MFFTRFQMNPQMRGSVRLAASPQRLHATVLSAFPPSAPSNPGGRVLWRLDTPSRHEWNLYIVSPRRPSLQQLQSECGWSEEESWRTAEYGPFLDRLTAGQKWTFRLAANPTYSVAGPRGSRGKRRPHVTASQQREWLLERANSWGFRVPELIRTGASSPNSAAPSVKVSSRERLGFERGRGDSRSQVTITRAQFDGLLEVTDEERLRTALVHGMGPARAYGCGLMSLAPVR